jgi:hypothetical protein
MFIPKLQALSVAAAALLGLTAVSDAAWADWTTPAPLYTPDDFARRGSYPRVAAAPSGGFHTVWQSWDDQNAAGRNEYLRYRRVSSTGVLSAPITIVEPGGVNKLDVGVAPNGDVHVVWESWGANGPEIGWARSTNAGASFSNGTTITAVNDQFGVGQDQSPQVVGLGTSGGEAILTWRNTSDDSAEYQRFNGTSWVGYGFTGHFATGFNINGIARNPVTGNVHKMVDNGTNAGVKVYTSANAWNAPASNVFAGVDQATEPSMAINAAGQSMFLIDNNFVSKAQLVNADGSLGTANADLFAGRRNFGQVTAIPGTNDFFAVATDAVQGDANHSSHIFGRRYSNGAWGPVLTLATIPEIPEMITNMDVAADAFGSIMVTWQYNVTNANATGDQLPWRPNVYYTINVVPEPAAASLVALAAGGGLMVRRPRRRSDSNSEPSTLTFMSNL